MFPPESEPYEHHRLRGHTTLENEPHINSFVGQEDGYDLMCKASASSKIFPIIRINRSTGNSSTVRTVEFERTDHRRRFLVHCLPCHNTDFVQRCRLTLEYHDHQLVSQLRAPGFGLRIMLQLQLTIV